MLIDWFTVAAQIVNFLALVWLLKHFLYERIIRAIDTREKSIATRLSEAEVKQKEAQQKLTLYEGKLADVEQQHQRLLAEAKQDAEKQHAAFVQQAREHVQGLEAKWQQELDRQRGEFLHELRRRSAAEILTVAGQAVADLACMDVQECAIRVFLEKIRLLNGDSCKSLAGGEILVLSALELSAETQAEIRQAIEERLDAPAALRFDRAPGLAWGIELRGNGRRIGWNSETYLEAMEEDLREALEQEPRRAAHAGAS